MSLYYDRTTGESTLEDEPITQEQMDAAIVEVIERDSPHPGEMLDFFPDVVDRGMKLGATFRLAAICALENPTPANLQCLGLMAIRCIRESQKEEAEALIRREE